MTWSWDHIKGLPGFFVALVTLIGMFAATAWGLLENLVSQEELNKMHCELHVSIRYNETEITSLSATKDILQKNRILELTLDDKSLDGTEREEIKERLGREILEIKNRIRKNQELKEKIIAARNNNSVWDDGKCVALD